MVKEVEGLAVPLRSSAPLDFTWDSREVDTQTPRHIGGQDSGMETIGTR